MLSIIDTATTQTDGTEAANAVVSPASLTVFATKGPVFLRGVGSIANDIVYVKVKNTSAIFLNNDLYFGPMTSTDTDGPAIQIIPPIPLEGNSTFAINVKTVAG